MPAMNGAAQNGSSHCCGNGEMAKTPLEAMSDPREKYLYVICLQSTKNDQTKPGYLATVDADPSSPKYGQVIHRLYSSDPRDELHHFGWNACVSCKNPSIKRRYLVIPALVSGNIYIVDTSKPDEPVMHKTILGKDISDKFDITFPHTVHCIPSGEVMISYMGDRETNAKGSFLLLDGETFEPKGLWNKNDKEIMGYDFWYQPRHNIMVSSEFGEPKTFIKGLQLDNPKPGMYGNDLHFWDWSTGKIINSQRIGNTGYSVPLELRFLHNPDATEGFVGVAFDSSLYRFFKTESGKWMAERVVDIPPKKVENFVMPEIAAFISDIIISMDDKYLYCASWGHGDVRQYDISDTQNPKLVSQVFLGGLVCKDSGVKVVDDKELREQPDRPVVKGKPVLGAPNMLQLSRDGKRLYVTMSIFTPYDKQFYPEMCEKGSAIYMLECSPQGMKISEEFCVDLSTEPDGGVRAHEVRYPGGDCTSDIWV